MAEQTKSSILLIDDDIDMLHLMKRWLELAGFEVAAFSKGAEGIQYAQNHPPTLIVSDIMMPEIDGFDVLRELRHGETALTPFILITSDTGADTMRKGLELGADDFLVRPVNRVELLVSINGQLNKYQQLLEHYNKRMEELHRAQQQISIMIAHELRTPVTALSMAQELMVSRLDSLSPDHMRELLNTMGSGTRRLKHLIEQMVLITEIEIGVFDVLKDRLIEESLGRLLKSSIILAQQFTYRNVPIPVKLGSHDASLIIKCYPAMFKHALAELIANAIKFSPKDSEVKITATVTNEKINLAILDQGEGITPEDIRVALREFRQINRGLREQQGIGMGLPLAKRVIDAHGGKLLISSTPGQGTTVTVEMPIAKKENVAKKEK